MDLGRAAYEGHTRYTASIRCHGTAGATMVRTAVHWDDLTDDERRTWAYVARAVGRAKARLGDNYPPVGALHTWRREHYGS